MLNLREEGSSVGSSGVTTGVNAIVRNPRLCTNWRLQHNTIPFPKPKVDDTSDSSWGLPGLPKNYSTVSPYAFAGISVRRRKAAVRLVILPHRLPYD